jgi:hypothetical protein
MGGTAQKRARDKARKRAIVSKKRSKRKEERGTSNEDAEEGE